MTPLRQRMIEDMQLRGLAERTQEAYQISDEELRQYFLYLTNEKKASRSVITIALCAIKFLYEQTLHQEWPTLTLVRPPREDKLPVILRREEVHRILKLEDDTNRPSTDQSNIPRPGFALPQVR
jgi:integrase/recombinase XerD